MAITEVYPWVLPDLGDVGGASPLIPTLQILLNDTPREVGEFADQLETTIAPYITASGGKWAIRPQNEGKPSRYDAGALWNAKTGFGPGIGAARTYWMNLMAALAARVPTAPMRVVYDMEEFPGSPFELSGTDARASEAAKLKVLGTISGDGFFDRINSWIDEGQRQRMLALHYMVHDAIESAWSTQVACTNYNDHTAMPGLVDLNGWAWSTRGMGTEASPVWYIREDRNFKPLPGNPSMTVGVAAHLMIRDLLTAKNAGVDVVPWLAWGTYRGDGMPEGDAVTGHSLIELAEREGITKLILWDAGDTGKATQKWLKAHVVGA